MRVDGELVVDGATASLYARRDGNGDGNVLLCPCHFPRAVVPFALGDTRELFECALRAGEGLLARETNL